MGCSHHHLRCPVQVADDPLVKRGRRSLRIGPALVCPFQCRNKPLWASATCSGHYCGVRSSAIIQKRRRNRLDRCKAYHVRFAKFSLWRRFLLPSGMTYPPGVLVGTSGPEPSIASAKPTQSSVIVDPTTTVRLRALTNGPQLDLQDVRVGFRLRHVVHGGVLYKSWKEYQQGGSFLI